MDLQISVFLLFILFTAGHSLNCYKCTGQSTCSSEFESCEEGSNCLNSVLINQFGEPTLKYKGCARSCQSGSMNIGTKQWYSECCDADFCNKLDLSEPSTIIPNGKKCYSCEGQSCTNTVLCIGDEDHCITATGHSDVVKGCISKSLCDGKTSIPNIVDFSCCEGNLCNRAQTTTTSTTMSSTTSTTTKVTMNVAQNSTFNSAKSVSQSFLFLCCSLLSFFLLH